MVVLTPRNDPKFISYCSLFIACMEQTFLFCYFGDRLTQEAGKVRESLYFNKWLDLDKSFKKSMLIVMTRMSKPIIITMGSISPVQLTTFIQIVRAAYSFMALLRNNNAANK
ncbi:odorant receptor 67c-like [Agrilus planipennis]|uniref:Odorant receptor 67c-like n=1 Tax=Agrilus planipennis TaxID=224129 RepID=A0A1W4XBP7_AGRPL|nr:odorant receptor 67c-like [Agrilus planipennis]